MTVKAKLIGALAVAALLVALMMITYIPQISLLLPQMLGLM